MIQKLINRLTNRGDRLETAASRWGDLARERQEAPMMGWLDSIAVGRLYVYPQMGVEPGAEEDWFTLTKKRYFSVPAGRALSIGCGNGYLERAILTQGVAIDVDGVDLSPGAVASARERAVNEGLGDHANYFVADLNTHVFPPNHYDAVFAAMALHHVENLEFHLDQIKNALKPGGLLIINEFVGPSQFQWTDKQVEMANAALRAIPEEYRRTPHGTVHESVSRPTIEQMNEMDPTESIRSAEIIPKVLERFEVVDRVDYGGTLLQLVLNTDVLQHLLGKTSPGKLDNGPEVNRIMETLYETERQAIRNGTLTSDFGYMVVRKPA